jgi:hypothetical protein
MTPRPRRNAGPVMTLAESYPLGPPAAILLRRHGLCRLSLLLGLRAEDRCGWFKQRELGQLLRGIAAVAEREPGELLRGIAAVGAGEQPDQDRHHANHGGRYPRDPHGHKAGQRDFRPVLHDDRSVSRYRIVGLGGCCPKPLRCLPRRSSCTAFHCEVDSRYSSKAAVSPRRQSPPASHVVAVTLLPVGALSGTLAHCRLQGRARHRARQSPANLG